LEGGVKKARVDGRFSMFSVRFGKEFHGPIYLLPLSSGSRW
jgi:hypothetical protein